MLKMSLRSVLFALIVSVILLTAESAPATGKDSSDSSGESSLQDEKNLDGQEEQKNLSGGSLGNEQDIEDDDFGVAVIKPVPQTTDKGTGIKDSALNPGKEPEIKEHPLDVPDYEAEDSESDKRVDEEDIGHGNDESKDENPMDEGEELYGDKNPKFPADEDDDKSIEYDNEYDDKVSYGGKNPKFPLDEDDGKWIKYGDDDEESPGYEDVGNDDDDEDEKVTDIGKKNIFHGGLFFDWPFFDMIRVRRYFRQLERALGHVFWQTMNEAKLLNGTFANTTEEEVVINGKKYFVSKSIIKGKDNHSTIYIEALSTRPKTNKTKVIED